MVDWQSPQEIAHDALAFSKFIHVLYGLYLWEWATSVAFDFHLLTGKRKFKWPMIFYLLNRYSLLAALTGLIVSFNVTRELDCQSLYIFCQLMGSFAIGLSSVNLSIRTMAVWRNNPYVVAWLIGMLLGHWGLLLRMVETIKAKWIAGQCQVTSNSVTFNSIVYSYTMVFDFIIMVLTGIKLQFGRGDYRSELVRLLYIDGLLYFVTVFLVNLIAVIFTILNLNPSMAIIADVPATTIATIAACRAVRRLSLYLPGQGPDIYTIPQFNIPKSSVGQSANDSRPDTRIQMNVLPTSLETADKALKDDLSPTTIKVSYEYDRDVEHGEGHSPVEIKVMPSSFDLYPEIERGGGRSMADVQSNTNPGELTRL